MTDCLQAGYSITRQSVIDIFFLCLWYALFFSVCSPGIVDLRPYFAYAISLWTVSGDFTSKAIKYSNNVGLLWHNTEITNLML